MEFGDETDNIIGNNNNNAQKYMSIKKYRNLAKNTNQVSELVRRV